MEQIPNFERYANKAYIYIQLPLVIMHPSSYIEPSGFYFDIYIHYVYNALKDSPSLHVPIAVSD